MIEKNSKQIHDMLNIELTKDSFEIGTISLLENEKIVLQVIEKYFNHINQIYRTVKAEYASKNSKDLDSEFMYQTLNMIKKKFFPTFRHFKEIYSKNSRSDDRFSQVPWYPQLEHDRVYFTSKIEPTVEDYMLFVYQHAPAKLRKILTSKVPILLNSNYLSAHTFIVGKSGYGKSLLMLELAKNIIDKKESSLVLIEPHGDLSDELAKLSDSKDLVYIDPFLKSGYIPTINLFEIEDISIENTSIYTGVIIDVFRQIIGGVFSPAMQSLLTPIVSVLLQIEGTSFFDMLRFLDDKNNKELLKYAQNYALNPSHREYFKTGFLENRASTTKFSIYSKLQILLQDPIFSSMLTGKSTINLEKLINTKGKVLIIKLNSIKMTETIESVGKFLTAIITSYVFKRENININKRVPTHFFIDEAPVFITEKGTARILEQARKYKLFLYLASQNNYQLGTEVNASVLSNTNLKFVTVNSNKNNKIMAPEMGVEVKDLDALINKGEFFVRVGTNKAFKLQISKRLLNENAFISNKEFEIIKEQQLKKYYRKVDYSDICYAKIPNEEKVKKHYSISKKEELLLDIENDETQLLDY